MIETDVLVVGAGPAGSVAALVLARAGARVRLIDRASFPRHKLCGDTLNPGALAILDRLGIASGIRRRGMRFTGMTVTGPGGESVQAEYPDGLCGLALMRRELDCLLIDAASDAGAVFDPGVAVRKPLFDQDRVVGVEADTGRGKRAFHARMVLAADGRHSTLGFALGLCRFPSRPRRWAFGAYFTDVDGLTSRGEMHIRRDSYVGVAALPDGVVNACVVHDIASRVQPRVKAEDVVRTAVSADDSLRERFVRARQISRVVSLGPLAVECRAPGHPGLLLAGDAAGFIDPMTGDGLRFALRGGELVAEAALKELASGVPAFHTLQAARAREFAMKWRVNRVLRSLVASPPALAVAARLASHWPTPFEHLVNVAGDVALARQV